MCIRDRLRRPSSGEFSLKQAITMQQLADAYWLWKEKDDSSAILRVLHPVEDMLSGVPKIVIKDGAAAALSHGAPLARPGIVKASAGTKAGSTVLIETLKGEAVSIAELTIDSDALPEIDSGEIAIPKSVLMSPGTYPQTWTKSN